MKYFCLLTILIFQALGLNAQLVTSNTMTPTQLVTQVLLGTGVTASNITFTGDVKQRTQFSATASTNLGISSGVFLSTGNGLSSSANGPQGPNNSGSTSTAYYTPGDALLDIASGNQTFDAAVLEFDFIPMGDSVKFRYSFASEEYTEFVNAGVNDVFGFFLTGPNPSGPNYVDHNIALVPSTTTPVSIDNVNHLINTSYFRNNNSNTIDVEFDGFTKTLYALEKVVCGQSYHIKIAIADGGDEVWDSGVFLEGGSFTSAAPISVSSSNTNLNFNDSLLLVEDCNTNCVYFIRQGNVAQADSFSLQVGGNAVLGTDYIQQSNPSFTWPSKIYFAAGQDSVQICSIYALNDNVAEPIDTIRFSISTFTTGLSVCALPATVSFNLYIKDYTPIVIGQGDSSFCNQVPVLVAHASGGVPSYAYSWQPGNGGASTYTVGPLTETTVFTLTVNDACNMTTTKTFSVNITPTVSVASVSVCAGEAVVLTATGAASYTWSTGATTNPITVSPPATTSYTVTGAIGPCTHSTVTTVNIITSPNITVSGNNNICEGQSTSLSVTGAASYTWSTGQNTSSITVSPSSSTVYQVSAGSGTCMASVNYPVNVTPIPSIGISGSVICAGQQASLTATGASSYQWSSGETGSTIHPSPGTTTTYSVTGANGSCSNTAVYTVTVTTDTPQLMPTGPYKFCVDTVRQVPIIVVSNNPNYAITWTIPSGGVAPKDTIGNIYVIASSQAGTSIYTITVTDLCNHQSSITVDITITACDIQVPNVVTANNDNVNDYFRIRGLESFTSSALSVYNRWGKQVYKNDDYRNDWKPDMSSGTYFYVLTLQDGRKYNGFFELFN